MSKKVATPKQTAGGGFAFEDKVVGYYLVWMLAGTAPLKASGRIDRVDCQVAVDGWEGFDDLLITMTAGVTLRRYAFSLKSNLQFTKESAPDSLVRSAWSLLLHRNSDVMNIEDDEFGLVCVPYPEPPKVAIQSLLIKARRQTPTQLSARLPVSGYVSDNERSIHNSCTCPNDLAEGLKEEKALAGNILKRMSVIELDFESAQSLSESTVLFVCSELVADGTSATAKNLWNSVCQTAQRVRTAGGGISRVELLSEMRSVVELRELPDYAEDWCHLDVWRDTELSAVPDSVAGTTSVDRDNITAKVVSSLQGACFIGVVGASGTGKTVIAKRVAEEFREIGSVLWLRGERIRPGYVEALGSHHHLRHPLKDVLSNGRRERGLVVIDSGERLLDEADFAELCLLLHMLEIDREGSVWRLLITCREEAWGRVQHSLIRAFGHPMLWEPVRIDYPEFASLRSVWEAFPALRTLAVRPHLKQVMRNLKVLDLLASAIKTGRDLDARSWVGESELIKWYWQQVVRRGENGARRAVLLQKLAAESADSGRFEIPEADFTAGDLALVGSSSDMLGTDSGRRMVFFAHDLIADWARFQALNSYKQDLAAYCEQRFTNPHWHSALRLYGVSLLEIDATGERWKSAIASYPGARDSFLESLVFAGNSQGLVNNAWSALVADKGFLLKAFLKRFQHVASIPNPEYMMLAAQMDTTSEEARTWERIPLWMYWLGVLYALSRHIEDLVELAPIETAKLVRSWLRHTPQDWPGRQQAATLALAIAQQAIRAGSYYHHSEINGQLPYKALLEAYPDKPDAVHDLLLKAAARKVPTEEDGEAFEVYEPRGTVTHMHSNVLGGDRISQEPWPDGPLYRVDSAFRAACFETDALRGIMTLAPDLAREIILALLIERRPPKMEPECSRESMLSEDAVCLEHDHGFYPRFYTRGPFLLFLKVNPEAALKTIIRLIDFATERWMECHYGVEDRETGIDLPLDGDIKRFIGDNQVYHWYHGHSRSDIATSALMAVEKWLYDCLDNKESIDGWLDLILKTSQSMAFLGVLSEVGRYAHGLFAGSLRPLILVPDTYYLETFYAYQGGHIFGTPASLIEGEWFFKLAREWDTMEHRQRRIVDIAAYLFHRHAETRDALLLAQEQWREVSGEGDEHWHRHKQTLIATFDDQNWKEVELADGSKGIAFKEPEHLRTPPDKLEQNEKQMLLLTLPMTCRKMLDEETRLENKQILSFLEKSKELLGFESDDEDSMQISPATNGVLGTIAVLFVLHRDWLRTNPNEETWCLEMLDKILADPPPWPEFDMPESVGNHDWEHFACEIAPVIWAENPGNREHRERIAHLALVKHYSAASILLFRAFERRKAIGNGFWELANLLLDWATKRYGIRDAQFTGEKVDISKWADKALRKFIAGKYTRDVPSWGDLSIEKGKLWASNSHPRYHGKEDVHLLSRIPRLDTQQIQATFASVFLPDQAIGKSERKRFLDFWDQALVTCLAGTRFFDKKGNELDTALTEAGLTYDYDNWVLKRLATIVGQMRPDEEPERYWKPILSLGPRAEHWVEHFLNHWFMDSKKAMDTTAFVREWRRMLDFCLASEVWAEKKGRSAYHLPSLWMCLVGLPRFTTSLWQDENAPIVEEMGEYFTKVAPYILMTAHKAVHFVSWLGKASAKGIRLQMLKPVTEAGLAASEHWWKEAHIARLIARYLGLMWAEHGQTLEHDPVQKRCFLELLHRASGTQEPLAMELQARMAARK